METNKTFIKDLLKGQLFTYDYTDTYEVIRHYKNGTTKVKIWWNHKESNDTERVESSEDIIPLLRISDLI